MNKVIKVKTDCPYFDNVGNLCSRVNGMARCDEYSECEFKYIDELKEENAKLKEELAEANQLKDMYHTYYRAKHDDIKGVIFKQKEKLEKIKELATPLSCNNPLDCWMNQDDGTGDIYGCDGVDYKGCPSGFASCVLKIIEGAEDDRN